MNGENTRKIIHNVIYYIDGTTIGTGYVDNNIGNIPYSFYIGI